MLMKMAMENNSDLNAAQLEQKAAKTNITNAFSFDKTTLYYGYDENDVAYNNKPNYKFGMTTGFFFPYCIFCS